MGACISRGNQFRNKISPSLDSLNELSNLTPNTEDDLTPFRGGQNGYSPTERSILKLSSEKSNRFRRNSVEGRNRQYSNASDTLLSKRYGEVESNFEALRGKLNGSWKSNNVNQLLDLTQEYIAKVQLLHPEETSPLIYNFDSILLDLWNKDFTENQTTTLQENSNLLLIYFESVTQAAILLSILMQVIQFSSRDVKGTTNNPLNILSIQKSSMLVTIHNYICFLQFYKYLFQFLNSPKEITSAFGMRFLNKKIITEVQVTIPFILSNLIRFETRDNEILFEKSYDNEIKELEERFHFACDLTMSDYYSVPLNMFTNSRRPKEVTMSKDLQSLIANQTNIEEDKSVKLEDLTHSGTYTLLFIKSYFDSSASGITVIRRVSLQLQSELIYMERDWYDTEKMDIILGWKHAPEQSESELTDEHLFTPKAASHRAMQAAAYIREHYGYLTNLLILTRNVFSGFLTDLFHHSRVYLYLGEAIDFGCDLLRECDHPLHSYILCDDGTLLQSSLNMNSFPISVHGFYLHAICFIQPNGIVHVPFVLQEMHSTKISMFQQALEKFVTTKKSQALVLVGKDSTLHERCQLHNIIQNCIIERFCSQIHLLRCTATKEKVDVPFFCIRKLLREILLLVNIQTDHQYRNIRLSRGFNFELDDPIHLILRNLVDPSQHDLLSVLNQPFGTHFPISSRSQSLFGHDLESVQDTLLLQIICNWKALLQKPLVMLFDSFEVFDRRSKEVVNLLWEHLMTGSVMFSVSLSDAKYWHHSVDTIFDITPITSRSQFEKYLEISVQDLVLGIDEQFVQFLLTKTNLDVLFAWEITQFLIQHHRVEIDENNILQFDPSIQFAKIMRIRSYQEFLKVKLSNMDMNLQLILTSLSIFKQPFSFQMVTYVLRDKFPGSVSFLWSTLKQLSVPCSENSFLQQFFLVVDEQCNFNWMSSSHRKAAYSFLLTSDEVLLKKNHIEFLEAHSFGGEEMLLCAEMILSIDDPTFVIANISIINEAIQLLEDQHRLEEAFTLLRKKITILSKDAKSSLYSILSMDYMTLANMLQKLLDDEPGTVKEIIGILKEGLIYCNYGTNHILQHQYLFQLWYFTSKVGDTYSCASFASKLLESQECIKDPQEAQITQVFTCMCKCFGLFAKEKYEYLLETEIEKCLIAYGKNGDEIHSRSLNRYGFVDPIVPILSTACCSAWMLSNFHNSKKYFNMAQQLLNRILSSQYKREAIVFHLYPCSILLGNFEDISHIQTNIHLEQSPSKKIVFNNGTTIDSLAELYNVYRQIIKLNDISNISLLQSQSNATKEEHFKEQSSQNLATFEEVAHSLHMKQCIQFLSSSLPNADVGRINPQLLFLVEKFEELYSHISLQYDHVVVHTMHLWTLLTVNDNSISILLDRMIQSKPSESVLPITPRSRRHRKTTSISQLIFTCFKAFQLPNNSAEKVNLLRMSIDSPLPLEYRILCAALLQSIQEESGDNSIDIQHSINQLLQEASKIKGLDELSCKLAVTIQMK